MARDLYDRAAYMCFAIGHNVDGPYKETIWEDLSRQRRAWQGDGDGGEFRHDGGLLQTIAPCAVLLSEFRPKGGKGIYPRALCSTFMNNFGAEYMHASASEDSDDLEHSAAPRSVRAGYP